MKKMTFVQREVPLAEKFTVCQPILSAVGDENRQLIIKVLIDHCDKGGLRVGEIQKNTNISRTAVSHHLKILKDAGIVMVRKEGTMNFYYLDTSCTSIRAMIEFWKEVEKVVASRSAK